MNGSTPTTGLSLRGFWELEIALHFHVPIHRTHHQILCLDSCRMGSTRGNRRADQKIPVEHPTENPPPFGYEGHKPINQWHIWSAPQQSIACSWYTSFVQEDFFHQDNKWGDNNVTRNRRWYQIYWTIIQRDCSLLQRNLAILQTAHITPEIYRLHRRAHELPCSWIWKKQWPVRKSFTSMY